MKGRKEGWQLGAWIGNEWRKRWVNGWVGGDGLARSGGQDKKKKLKGRGQRESYMRGNRK